uniref:Uncharacterized protein n=1 Tax=mine drainage metagenome TaxID=410659 RepID=E6QVW6_9ZZZZ
MITIESTPGTAWIKAVNGHRSIQFIISDIGVKPQPNDRYTVIFDDPITIPGSNRGTTYPYLSMNNMGMGYRGEVDPAYVEAAMRGDITGERLICWADINHDCCDTVLAELRSYLDNQFRKAG